MSVKRKPDFVRYLFEGSCVPTLRASAAQMLRKRFDAGAELRQRVSGRRLAFLGGGHRFPRRKPTLSLSPHQWETTKFECVSGQNAFNGA